MARTNTRKVIGSGVRRGTATRRAGKETSAKLVEAARQFLESDSYENFSMRSVADHAGVSLANLQYYFPRREDLANALFVEIGNRYQAAYDSFLKDLPTSPVERFKRVIQYQFEDILEKKTRQFFIQFWALLGSMDGFEGRYFGELYGIDVRQLSEHIAAMSPQVPAEEIRRRATLIAGMIEGLMVVMGETHKNSKDMAVLQQSVVDAAMSIACDDKSK